MLNPINFTDSGQMFCICQAVIWEFLCNSDLCIQNRALHLTQLCESENKTHQCKHCCFRKAFFILKTLTRTKLVQSVEVARVKRISMLMYENSEAIVQFCIGKIEEKFDIKCIADSQKKEVQEIQQTKIHRILEVEKMYLNKFISSFDELSLDVNKKLHGSVKSLANPEASEWFFSYSNGETIELFSRSKDITDVVSHVLSHDKMGNVSQWSNSHASLKGGGQNPTFKERNCTGAVFCSKIGFWLTPSLTLKTNSMQLISTIMRL